MATLGASSTDIQVFASYDDNASYREDNSLAKAKAFETAINILLRRSKSLIQEHGAQMQADLVRMENRLPQVIEFININDTVNSGPKVTHPDFTDFGEK